MRVGVFADTHDHLDNIRRAVQIFNAAQCECVLFAGDLVSTFAVPPLRQLNCPIYGCFGDNEGNKIGLQGGFKLIGKIQEAPAEYQLADGTRVAIVHMQRQFAGFQGEFDIAVFGHTHKPEIRYEDAGKLWLNPGETSGWTYGRPTVALLNTETKTAEIVDIDMSEPLPSWDADRRARATANSKKSRK